MSLRLRLIAVATGRARAGRLSGAWPRPAAALAAWPKLRVDSESDHGALSRTCNATRDSNRAHWQFKSVAASFKFRVTGKLEVLAGPPAGSEAQAGSPSQAASDCYGH